jgi:hypothetical protein
LATQKLENAVMRKTVDISLGKDFDKFKTATALKGAALQAGLDELKDIYLAEEVKNYIVYLKTAKYDKVSCLSVT